MTTISLVHTGSVVARVNNDRNFTAHQDGGEKYVTGVTTRKVRAIYNIIIGTWNVRTLRMVDKLELLTYEKSRYRCDILGLCEVRWQNFGDTSTQEGHKLYFSGKEDKNE